MARASMMGSGIRPGGRKSAGAWAIQVSGRGLTDVAAAKRLMAALSGYYNIMILFEKPIK